MDVQDELQTLYTSGTVFHAFLGEKLPSWQSAAKLVRTIAENYKLPYYTMSPTYSVCKDHGYLTGEQATCPKCGAKTEIYSRITGYYRPVQNWNEGKIQEYKNRRLYEPEHEKIDVVKNKENHQEMTELHAPEEEITIHEGELNLDENRTVRYLFTTKTCPNCAKAKEILSDEEFVIIDAEEEPELTAKYGVMQAPTLVVVDGDNSEKFVNASNIQKYVSDHRS